jgi:hypothetical protein
MSCQNFQSHVVMTDWRTKCRHSVGRIIVAVPLYNAPSSVNSHLPLVDVVSVAAFLRAAD